VEWATVEKVLRTVDVTRVGNLGYSVILRRYINWWIYEASNIT